MNSGPPRQRVADPARPGLVPLVLNPATADRQGQPLLDPTRWTPRHRWALIAGLLIASTAGLWVAIKTASAESGSEGLRAFIAAAIGVGMIWLAASLRGITLPGFIVGGLYVFAGMLSWTYTDTGKIVWVVLAVEAVIFTVWTFPWLRDLLRLPRLGAAWLGLAYWLLGAIGAVLVWHPGVAAGRIAYLAIFTVGALAIVVATRKSGQDLTIGIVASFLVALALLMIVGSANALHSEHLVPKNSWGAHMEHRFWGGPGLLYHPNSMALIAVIVSIRIAGDRAFEYWQRYAALAVTTCVLLLVNSRTGLLYLGVATVVWAVLIWISQRGGREIAGLDRFATNRGALVAALLPMVLVGAIAIGSGGVRFLTVERYGDGATGQSGGVTSGRTSTWKQVWKEFEDDNIAQKVFGDAKYTRGYVVREDTAVDPAARPKLTVDNAAVAALRRGGILGALAFLFGLVLLLTHAIRGPRRRGPGINGPGINGPGINGPGAGTPAPTGPPAWFTMAAVGSVFTIVTASWLLGNTGGTLWVFLLAAEAYLLFRRTATSPQSG